MTEEFFDGEIAVVAVYLELISDVVEIEKAQVTERA